MEDSYSTWTSYRWHFLEMDVKKGQFTPANDAIGGLLVSRYFVGTDISSADYSFRNIVIYHAKAVRETEPTATAAGHRHAYLRDRDTTAGGKAELIGAAEFADLVPDIDDSGYGMAHDPNSGDLYILTGTATASYLCAIRPSIDDDSEVLPTFEVIDLDPNSENTYLTLADFHADLALSAGLTFDDPAGDGSSAPSRLYIGALSAIYALDVASAGPPPATATVIFVK